MGFFKRLSFNWDKLSNVILEMLEEKECTIPDETKSYYYTACIERCRTVEGMLPFFKRDKYMNRIIKECEAIIIGINNKIDDGPAESIDKNLQRALAMAAIMGYCQQFYTDDGVDSEFFYILYNKVISKLGISALT